MHFSLTADNKTLVFPKQESLIRGIHFDKRRHCWSAPVNQANINIVLDDREPKSFDLYTVGVQSSDSPLCETQGVPSNKALMPHQELIVKDMLQYRRRIIAAQMRTGKTLATLEVLQHLQKTHNNQLTILYLAPISGVKSVEQEMVKWGFNIENLVLTNYEKFHKVYDPEQAYYEPRLAYDVIVFDEGHRLKDPSSKRSRMANTIAMTASNRAMELRGDAEDFYIFILSGTPAPKDPTDWWHLIEITHPGFQDAACKEDIMRELGTVTYNDYNGYNILEMQSFDEDMVKHYEETVIHKVTTTVLKASVLDLPEKIEKIHQLKPTTEMLSALQLVKQISPDVVTMLRKTMQVSDGFLYQRDTGDVTIRTETNPKMDRLKELLVEIGDDNRVCILGGFTETIDMLTETVLDEGWNVLRVDGRGYKFFSSPIGKSRHLTPSDALAQMDESNKPNRQYPLAVIGHPKSVATGLELSATKHMIYYSLVFDGEAYFQSSERAHSMNMRDSLTLHYLFNLHTDRYLFNNLKTKGSLQSLTMQELRKVLEDEIVHI